MARRLGLVAGDDIPFPVWYIQEVAEALGNKDIDRNVWLTMPILARILDKVIYHLNPQPDSHFNAAIPAVAKERERGLITPVVDVRRKVILFLSFSSDGDLS